jgi:uncharacterized transporter YbjL
VNALWKRVNQFLDKVGESPKNIIRFFLITAAYGFPLGMLSGGIVMYVGQGMGTFLLLLPLGYLVGGFQAWKSINRN